MRLKSIRGLNPAANRAASSIGAMSREVYKGGGKRRKENKKGDLKGSGGGRGENAPENGDLRVRRGCGWLARVSLPMAESSSSLSPHRYIRRQRDAPALVRTGPHPLAYIRALLRGIYIIRPRLESNIMNHAPCPSRA